MKKRLLSLVLVLALVLALGLPALAANEDELTQVTLAVKSQLDISDQYTTFTGDSEDLGVLQYWSLYWSDDDNNSISVTADTSGKVLSYYVYGESNPYETSGSTYNAAFPKVTEAQLTAMAEEFLGRVLSAPESARLDPVNLSISGSQRYAWLSGTILRSGLPTSITFSLRINLTTLTVTGFNRDDYWSGVFLNDPTDVTPAVAVEDAAAGLRSVLALELQYVNGDDGTLTLRYVPTTQGNWYVDAKTGDLTDLSAVYDALEDDGIYASGFDSAATESAVSADGSGSLSAAEQAAVEQLAGVLSAEELDALLRQYPALGLDTMTQAGNRYTMDAEDGSVTCTLTYTRPLSREELSDAYDDEAYDYLVASGDAVIRKYITVDGATGQLLRLYTSDYLADGSAFTGDSTAVAEGFLSQLYPTEFAATQLTDDDGTYTRVENGIPYYANYLSTTVSGVDGSIRTFQYSWDDALTFPAPDGICTPDEALTAYGDTFETTLQFVAYPVAVDTSDSQWMIYAQMMGRCAYNWVLAYALDSDKAAYGVDAFTGEALFQPADSTAVAYTDSASSYAQAEIEALAAYGVGFGASETFRPTAQLTQREMLVLLLSAKGGSYDVENMDESQENALYADAYSYGLLTRAQRDPDRAVTRLDFLKALLGATVYGKAAQITGIYQVRFADAASIAEDDLGYVAIAQGLGLVGGDDNGLFRPDATLTRQDAAIMLYRFMML